LVVVNKKLVLENKEKARRAAELVVAKNIALENEKKLNILNFQLNKAQETAKIGSWSWDSIKDEITWSKELYHIYGLNYHKDAPNYREHLKLYSLEGRKVLDDAVKIALKKGTSYSVQLKLQDTKRGIKWVVGSGEVIKNSKGQIVGQRGTVQDVTNQKEFENKIIRSSALISSLLDSIPDVIFYKDLEGVYLGCNPAFSEFVGRPRDMIIGKTDYDLFSKEVADSFRVNDKKMLDTGEPRHNEEWVTYPNGKKVLLDTLKTPYYGPNKERIGILGISRDITERSEIEKMKSEFISVASHQLKTPLSGIKWLSELLIGGKIDKPTEKQKEYLEDIHFSNERMINLVDDLLDISNIEAGNKSKLVKKETDIMEILGQVLLDDQQLAREKEVNIIKCENAPTKFIMNIDGDKIRQVFANLINNAIKYSKNKGLVEVDCEHKNNEVVFRVKDNGIGIPKEQQKQMFLKFFRADNARESEPNGTGLGLYIAKAIAEAHGGKLWFESEENKGTTFYFSLPQ